MSTPKFAETHNLVAFLEKQKESNGFEGIIDCLNASFIKYALTVNPTVYESCIKQFWTTAKDKTINREHQIQALVDKKKVIITEKSVRSDLMLEDADGTECLENDEIFEQLTLMGAKTTAWNEFSITMASAIICLATNKKINFSKYIFDNMMKNLEGGVKFLMYSRFVQVFLDKQVEGMSKHKGIYVTPSHFEKVFANMKKLGKDFSGKVTPLFQTMMVQAPEDMGEDLATPIDSHSTPIITQPSSSKPQKKKFRRKQRKDSGSTKPIPDEATNEELTSTPSYDPPESGEDRIKLTELMSLCTKLQKQGRKIADLDADAEVTLIDETQERNDEEMLFDVQNDLQGEEVVAKKEVVAEKEVSAADLVTTDGDRSKQLNPVTTVATTTTTTRLKARGVVVQVPSEFKTTSSPLEASQLPQAKDKGKAKMVEPKKPLKKKDQITIDEEVVRNLEAQLQAKLEEEERLSRLKEEEANIALLES
ncbi:hypothetical protein Tco_0938038 [Tanacetum coccineum]|uniref:Xylulose kinase-1 n=1 Tax=Tanacetum coccineum TaxID=301880 RepID=A0ABQ5DIQ6_9ASTR